MKTQWVNIHKALRLVLGICMALNKCYPSPPLPPPSSLAFVDYILQIKISSMAKWLPAAIHLHPLSVASSKERGFLFVCVRLSISGDSKWPGLVLCPEMSLSLWPRRSGTCEWVQSGSQVFSMVGLGHCNWQPHQALREWKSSSREKRRLWIGNQKIIAIKEGLSWIEYSKLLANQSKTSDWILR